MQDEEPGWEKFGKNNNSTINISNPLKILKEKKYKEIIRKSRADSHGAAIEELENIRKDDPDEHKKRIQKMVQEAVDIAYFKRNDKKVIELRKKAQKKGIHLKNPSKYY